MQHTFVAAATQSEPTGFAVLSFPIACNTWTQVSGTPSNGACESSAALVVEARVCGLFTFGVQLQFCTYETTHRGLEGSSTDC